MPTYQQIEAMENLAASLVGLFKTLGREFANHLGQRMAAQLVHDGPQETQQPIPPPSPFPKARPNRLLYSMREASALLGISERHLYNFIAPRGSIPVVRIGAIVRIDPIDLVAAIETMKFRQVRSHDHESRTSPNHRDQAV